MNDCSKPKEYKKLLFAICNFHAIIIARSKYGENGWNLVYDWTDADLNVSKKALKILLDEYKEVPYQLMTYLIGEILYGGRVIDDKDYRLMKTLIKTYIIPEIMQDGYKFSKSGLYYSPQPSTLSHYISYIESLPVNIAP